MAFFNRLKQLFIAPMSKRIPVVLVGTADQWAIPVGSMKADSFVVSAGVGHDITFEHDLVSRFGVRIILLDPSPTGIKTVSDLSLPSNIEFHPVGLAAKSGSVSFGQPDRPDEGSFRKSNVDGGVRFHCTTLQELMTQHNRSRIDLLKIDVEGFEYEIIESILAKSLDVRQICLEIHHNKVISIDNTIFDAAKLIIRMFFSGYRIVYNKNMDFTFVRS